MGTIHLSAVLAYVSQLDNRTRIQGNLLGRTETQESEEQRRVDEQGY